MKDGFLIINKEAGMTSRDVDNIIMHSFATKKVGHLGTLDPLATGVLVLALGKALKVVSLIEEHEKRYRATITVGLQTDTLDITGEVLSKSDKRPSKEEVIEVLNSLLGENLLEVPKYSAIKINGKKLYEYARANLPVELPKKTMTLIDYSLLDFNKDSFEVEMHVSYGTYIRSLINEIGKRLNVPMTMSQLERISSGDFHIDNSVLADEASPNNLISIEEILSKYQSIKVDDNLKSKILNGQILPDIYHQYPIIFLDEDDKVIAIYKQYEKDENYVKPHKIIS